MPVSGWEKRFGEITPDTYIIDRDALTVKETLIGSKEHMLVSTAGQGTNTRELSAAERKQSSLKEPVLRERRADGMLSGRG